MLHGSDEKVIENPDTELSEAMLQRCVIWFSEEGKFPGVLPETGTC